MTARVLEQRATPGVVQLRAAADGTRHIEGYALKWNTRSQNLGGYVETIAPGSADKTLGDGGNVLCRFQHEDQFLLGTTDASTLLLTPDNVGVFYDCLPPQPVNPPSLMSLIDRGDVKYSSFAFRCFEDDWSFTEQGFPMRTLLQFQLVDVAPVVNPGYLDTSTGLRSLAERRGIDLDTVLKAAKHDGLSDLLRSGAPVTIDLGAKGAKKTGEKRDGDCGCCALCLESPDGCPGCSCPDGACTQCDGPNPDASRDGKCNCCKVCGDSPEGCPGCSCEAQCKECDGRTPLPRRSDDTAAELRGNAALVAIHARPKFFPMPTSD